MSPPHCLLSCVADQRLHLEASGKCRGLYLQGHPPKHWGKNNVGGDWAPEQIEKILRDTANQKTEKQPIGQGANTRPGFPARKAGTTPHPGSKTGQKGSRCAYPVKRPV